MNESHYIDYFPLISESSAMRMTPDSDNGVKMDEENYSKLKHKNLMRIASFVLIAFVVVSMTLYTIDLTQILLIAGDVWGQE